MRKKTILVTGGAGFIGSHIVRALVKLGYRVVIVDNLNRYYDPELKRARLNQFLGGISFKFYKVDISDFKSLKKVFIKNRFDAICHQAAQAGVRYSLENPFSYIESNIVGTHNLLELARKFRVNSFIFASSSSVYGNTEKFPTNEKMDSSHPISLYGATKKAGEVMIHSYHKAFGIHATCLRYFTVYGPWGRPDMALFKFTKNILEGKPIEVYNYGRMERDFTYIDDIVSGVISSIQKNLSWAIINLGRGKSESIERLIEILEDSLGKRAKKKLMPMQPGDVRKSYADIRAARKLLNWQPRVNLEQGVNKFLDWYLSYYGYSKK